MSMKQRFGRFWRRFASNRRGTTAVIFGFLAVPVMAMAGAGYDYATAIRVKARLSATLDAAALAAAQAHALDDSADVSQIVHDFVEKNYSRSGKNLFASHIGVEQVTVSEDGEVVVVASARVPTTLLSLVGFDEFDFSIGSAAKVGGQSLELALVLDNTGSMMGAKLDSLKNSAHTLVDELMKDSQGNVKVALAPFADYVNIGMANRSEPGLDIPADYTYSWHVDGHEHCWNEYPNSTEQCTTEEYEGTCYNDGVPYTCTKTRENCTGDPGDPVRHCEWVPGEDKHRDYKWFGCMASRPHDLNVRDDGYATGVPGVMATWDWCRQIAPIQRLTSNQQAIDDAIDAMQARRNTYIPAGLAWGWRLLSHDAPFSDGAAYDNDAVTKVIVLMTDGENTLTMRKWSGHNTDNHSGEVWGHDRNAVGHPSRKAEADGYTAELCQNIKARGIVVHTIAFEVPEGSPVENLMRNCAGNGGQYFKAEDSEALANAFHRIALALLNLRLSR